MERSKADEQAKANEQREKAEKKTVAKWAADAQRQAAAEAKAQKVVAEEMPWRVTEALKDLLFRDVQGVPALDVNRKPIMRNGKPVMAYHPHLRPMVPGDVLSSQVHEGRVTIVGKDGMKHEVKG